MDIIPEWLGGKKKKKKKMDWKGESFPYIQKGESPAEWGEKVKAWKKANPGKEIPDSDVFYLADPQRKPPSTKKKKKKKKKKPQPPPPTQYLDMPENMKDPMRLKRHHKTGKITEMGAKSGGYVKKYAHGGSVRKTRLSDY